MRSILKKFFYFVAILVIIAGDNCRASYAPPEQPQPGGYGIYPEIGQWPAGSYTPAPSMQPVYIHHQDFSYQPSTPTPPDTSKDEAIAQALAKQYHDEEQARQAQDLHKLAQSKTLQTSIPEHNNGSGLG